MNELSVSFTRLIKCFANKRQCFFGTDRCRNGSHACHLSLCSTAMLTRKYALILWMDTRPPSRTRTWWVDKHGKVQDLWRYNRCSFSDSSIYVHSLSCTRCKSMCVTPLLPRRATCLSLQTTHRSSFESWLIFPGSQIQNPMKMCVHDYMVYIIC